MSSVAEVPFRVFKMFRPSLVRLSQTLAPGNPQIRSALVTGGGSGIGLAIAHAFAREGIRCTLVGRTESKLKTALGKLPVEALPEGQAHKIVVADVSQSANWEQISGEFEVHRCPLP